MSTNRVRLLVVANILLEPSYPIYLLTGTSIKYRIFLIKQASSDEIPLPSKQYYFESSDSTCAQLKPIDSSILSASHSPCKTNMILNDRNMKQYAEQYIPPTSEVTVVQASYIKFSLKNYPTTQQFINTWVLEIEKIYEIEIFAYTADHKQIYASDDIKFDTVFDLVYVNIIKSSLNGSYFSIYAKKPGVTQGRATLEGVLDESGKLNSVYEKKIVGKQDIELVRPIKISPELLIFAWKFNNQQITNYEYQFEASGGSTLYHWQSKNASLLTVSNTGYIKLNNKYINLQPQQTSIESFVFVYDQKNANINAASRVLLVEPTQLDILKCPIETKINKTINIRLQMHSIHRGEKLLVSDCSKLNFKIWLQNENIFKFIKIDASSDPTSCAIVNLVALNEGSTLIRVSYEVNSELVLDSEQIIYSFSNLKTDKSFYLLNHLSSFLIQVSGGLYLNVASGAGEQQHQKLNEKLTIENQSLVDIIRAYDSKTKRNNYKVQCKKVSGETKIRIEISNENDYNLNSCPLKFENEFIVKCSKPFKFELNQLLMNKSKLSYLPECPFKPTVAQLSNSNMVIQHCRLPLKVEVRVKDELGNEFDNFTSKNDKIEWSIDNTSLLLTQQNVDIRFVEIDSKLIFYNQFETNNLIGEVNIEAKFKHLSAKLFVKLIDNLKIVQNGLQLSKITVINHPTNILNLQIIDGSGYYFASLQQSMNENRIIDFSLNENNLLIKPLSIGNSILNIFDYCVLQSEIQDIVQNEQKLQLQVTDINTIQVEAIDNKIQVDKYLILFVHINDANGNRLKKSLFSLMNLKCKLNNNNSILISVTPEMVNSNNEFYLTMIKSTLSEQINYERIIRNNFNDEYSALYILQTHSADESHISIQFEANLNNGPLIQSKQIDIVVYSPLKVHPKRLDLIIGSNYQLKFSGGPELSENIILKYELINEESAKPPVLNIQQNGSISALNNGNVTVNVKIIGLCNDNNVNNYKLCELIKISSNSKNNEIVYTFDLVQISVVQLKSFHIETPLKYIKIGNQVPLHLIANKQPDGYNYLRPPSFGTSNYLAFKWSVNNNNLANLETNLAESGLDFGLNSFSLVLSAQRVGTVRVSVQVNVLNSDIVSGSNSILLDHIDLIIVDSAKFLHLNNNFNTLILTPGSHLQIKTNRDSQAKKLTYELYNSKFMSEDYVSAQQQQSCSNDKQIQIDSNGVFKVDKNINLRQYNHETCVSTVLVRIEEEFKKDQYLYYLIKIKQIKYFMLKSKTNMKLLHDHSSSSIINSLPIDLKVNLKFSFFDDIGDEFHSSSYSSVPIDYDLSRNDLIQIKEKEGNLFSLKSLNVGNTLISLKNANHEQYLSLPSNKLNLFKIMNLNVNQMDIIRLNRDILFEYVDQSENVKFDVKVNESQYFWSLKDYTNENEVQFVDNNAICLLNGNYELELKSNEKSELNFESLKITVHEIESIKFSDATLNSNSFTYGEHLEANISFISKQQISLQEKSDLIVNPNLHDTFNCLLKLSYEKTHSMTQKMIESDNFFYSNLNFEAKYQKNKWSCELSSIKMNPYEIYEFLINLYKPATEGGDQQQVGENIEFPTHLVLYSNLKTTKNVIESNRVKIDFYVKFSMNVDQISFNLNNLYPNEIRGGNKQINKLRIENNFNSKFFLFVQESLSKKIVTRLSHPNLFKIKQLNYSRKELKLHFNLELIEFNIETLVQANLEGIFVEIMCELTKQKLKMPIRIHFDKSFNLVQDKLGLLHVASQLTSSDTSGQQNVNRQRSGFFSSFFPDFTSGQVINYLAIISLILFIVLVFLKFKIPNNNQPPIGLQTPHKILNNTLASTASSSSTRRLPQLQSDIRYRGANTSSSFQLQTPYDSFSYSPNRTTNNIRLFSVDSDISALNNNNDNSKFNNPLYYE